MPGFHQETGTQEPKQTNSATNEHKPVLCTRRTGKFVDVDGILMNTMLLGILKPPSNHNVTRRLGIIDDIRSNVETRPTYTGGMKRCTICSHIPHARWKNEPCLADNTALSHKNDGIARLHDDAAVCLHILAPASWIAPVIPIASVAAL